MTPKTTLTWALACTAALAACGGGSGSASIGGSLGGLDSGQSIVLQNTNTTAKTVDSLTLSTNQTYKFAVAVPSGNGYSVTVGTQPIGQSCTVANATGVVDSFGDAVTNVNVSCTYTASVGGVLAGLKAGNGVVLISGNQTLALAQNGLFAIPGLLTPGSTFSVAVAVQPTNQTCTISNGVGTVASNAMARVTVTCV